MIYRVIMDGNDILNFAEKPYILLNPTLETEINMAGSLEFTMHPSHAFYDDVLLLVSTLEVYEDEDLIWFGRPAEIKTDFHKNKIVYCEGALAFFNDTVQIAHEYNSISIHEFFRRVVTAHNSQVAASRQFTVGQITIPDEKVYRNLRYESTANVLKRQCLSSHGGYFFLHRGNGVNTIDWLAEMPYTCNQPAEFGLNLLDFSANMEGSSVATCILPLGEKDESTGKELTVESINDGSPIIESAGVSVYGKITKVVTFNGVKDPQTLYEDGIEYLASTQFAETTIECTAAELHKQNPNFEKFMPGQTVRCHSVPHLLDREFPLLRISVRLDTAAKRITLGNLKKQTLTEIEREENSNINQNIENIGILLEETNEMAGIPTLDSFSGELQEIVSSWESYLTPTQWGEVQDIVGSFASSDNMSEASANLSDLVGWMNDNATAFGLDYPDISSEMSGFESAVGTAMNLPSMYDMAMQLENGGGGGGGGDGWIHRIDGEAAETGTVNFVTVGT